MIGENGRRFVRYDVLYTHFRLRWEGCRTYSVIGFIAPIIGYVYSLTSAVRAKIESTSGQLAMSCWLQRLLAPQLAPARLVLTQPYARNATFLGDKYYPFIISGHFFFEWSRRIQSRAWSDDRLGRRFDYTPVRLYAVLGEFPVFRFHDKKLRFANAGIKGDRAGDLLDGFDEDVAKWQPQYVTLLLGLNDGRYQAFQRGNFGLYQRDM